jgi:2-oxoglutarate ferredoxin oxidoreductase subunit delta
MVKLEVLAERCKGCGLCVESCPKNILKISNKTNKNSYFYVEATNKEECIGCGNCYIICPDSAIEIKRSKAK